MKGLGVVLFVDHVESFTKACIFTLGTIIRAEAYDCR